MSIHTREKTYQLVRSTSGRLCTKISQLRTGAKTFGVEKLQNRPRVLQFLQMQTLRFLSHYMSIWQLGQGWGMAFQCKANLLLHRAWLQSERNSTGTGRPSCPSIMQPVGSVHQQNQLQPLWLLCQA